jgi:formylglycine-generating enzyme required for sulfatase activity
MRDVDHLGPFSSARRKAKTAVRAALLLWGGSTLALACHPSSPRDADDAHAPPSRGATVEAKGATRPSDLADDAGAQAAPPTDAPPPDERAESGNGERVVAEPPKPDAAAGVDEDAVDGMLRVPGGPFTMGADRGGEEDEHPAHEVTVDAFWLDRTEVTNAAYAECVAAKACREKDRNVASRNHAGPDASFDGPNQPVVGVSWNDARAYCAFRGKRLPREAEWEKAARGDDARKYPWGNEKGGPEHGVFGRMFGRDTTEDVGSYPKGRGPYGHLDLAGNVWEWVEDEYDPFAYRRSTADRGVPGTCPEILAAQNKLRAEGKQGFTGTNPIPTECERVLRGGAFNYPVEGVRASNRVHHAARFRLVMSGFRCAKDMAP